MNIIKYLDNGMEVSVIREIEGGLLVSDCYEYGDDVRNFFVDDKVYFVERVYDRAPTQRFDAKIAEIEDKIKTAQKKYIEIENKIAELNITEKQRLEKYKQYQQLNRLDDFLDGEITHIVFLNYQIKIEEWGSKELNCNENHKSLKLITLFGDSNGDLQWNLNSYRDGSGSNISIVPCCSYPEAIAVIQKHIDDLLANNPNEYNISYCIDAVKGYNLKIDQKWIDNDKEKRTKIALKKVLELETSLANAKKELDKIPN